MNVILFDDPTIRRQLFPFTLTRPCANVRVGIRTITEKWESRYKSEVSFLTPAYLSKKFPIRLSEDNLFINGALCPDEEFRTFSETLRTNEAIVQDENVWAFRCNKAVAEEIAQNVYTVYENLYKGIQSFSRKIYQNKVTLIKYSWNIFQENREEIIRDFTQITQNRRSFEISDAHTAVYGSKNVFIEEGASVKAAVINAEEGPVYIGKNAVIHEGALIKGPAAVCEGAHVNPGTRVRPGTTIGPFCKVGGEISESVLFGFSNKAHDGFLGNAVVGEWCNLGAGTNNSNLKNNYGSVKVWGYREGDYVDTGLQFCGLFMGDHSKCGIGTLLNTGTSVGVFANIFGEGFPPKLIPSFSWGGKENREIYRLTDAIATAERMAARRGYTLREEDKNIFTYLFDKKHNEVF